MEKILFREQQKMSQAWIWAIVILTTGIWLWQFIQQILLRIPFGTNPAPDAVIILTGIIPAGAVFLFFSLKLETVVTRERISYRFLPFQRKPKYIGKEEILHCEVKKYSPIRDYGGWGIRTGFGSKGTAYNVKGNQGAYFVLRSGKKILIGTQEPAALDRALQKMMKEEHQE